MLSHHDQIKIPGQSITLCPVPAWESCIPGRGAGKAAAGKVARDSPGTLALLSLMLPNALRARASRDTCHKSKGFKRRKSKLCLKLLDNCIGQLRHKKFSVNSEPFLNFIACNGADATHAWRWNISAPKPAARLRAGA